MVQFAKLPIMQVKEMRTQKIACTNNDTEIHPLTFPSLNVNKQLKLLFSFNLILEEENIGNSSRDSIARHSVVL